MWMKRGTQIKWFPEHAIPKARGAGWVVAQQTRQDTIGAPDPSFVPSPSGREIGSQGDATIVDSKEFGHWISQVRLNNGDTPNTRSPRAAAQEWFKNEGNAAGYRMQSWELVGQEDGSYLYEATWVRPFRQPGTIAGSPAVPLPGQDTKRARFKIPMDDASKESPQDAINKFVQEQEQQLADFFEFTGVVNKNEAKQLQNRILDFPSFGDLPGNLPAGMQQNYTPSAVATQVARVLNNERLGDPERRKFLANMVLEDMESTIWNTGLVQDNPDLDDPELTQNTEQAAENALLNAILSALGGGRGGGGSAPVYQPPDRREVEENVERYLGMVIPSRFDKEMVKNLADTYMREHRAAFDNPESGVRPWYSVKEQVQKMKEYERIHKLRPDTIAEEEWATRYLTAIEQAGVPEGLRDRTAANFATIGATLPAATSGAFRQQEMRTGRAQPVFLQNMRNAAQALAARF